MSEEIRKSFSGEPLKADARNDIDLINRYALRELSPDEVFAFNIIACDTQIDRDYEVFSEQSLHKLAKLLPGKPLIHDHDWTSKNQRGRVYRCQVVQDGNVSRLRASVYMMRTPGTEETIKQIEGGVLREVSISFTMKKLTCSICGEEMVRSYFGPSKCKNDHEKGKEYNGKRCVGIIDPSDALEVSFVAVPAQREAGTTKSHAGKRELSPEENSYRRKVFEDAIGGTVTDDVWKAVLDGKISGSEFAMAYRQQKEENKKQKYYADYIPNDEDDPDSIPFAIIPDEKINRGTYNATLRALGFCRKELNLQPIKVRWFVTLWEAKKMGLDTSKLSTFRKDGDVVGIASRENPNQILVRYGQSYEKTMEAVFHECWHTFQFKDDLNPAEETNAYWYQQDALKRYKALSDEEQQDLFYGELLMKDYRQK